VVHFLPIIQGIICNDGLTVSMKGFSGIAAPQQPTLEAFEVISL